MNRYTHYIHKLDGYGLGTLDYQTNHNKYHSLPCSIHSCEIQRFWWTKSSRLHFALILSNFFHRFQKWELEFCQCYFGFVILTSKSCLNSCWRILLIILFFFVYVQIVANFITNHPTSHRWKQKHRTEKVRRFCC